MADEAKPVEQVDVNRVKSAWYWVKDTSGHGSVSVTFALVAFWVTTLAYIMSMVEKVGPVSIRQFDIAACSAYFIPILTLYFGRRWTEAKFSQSNEQK